MIDTKAIAIAGAGMVGRRHIEAIRASQVARLHSIVDPADAAGKLASALGVPWYPCIEAMLAASKPDGVIIATPNAMHVENGLECVGAGVPALVEKPLATSVAEAGKLVEASTAARVALLVGHHRRHNPRIAAAKRTIASGSLGRIISVHAMFWTMKPDDYFEVDWRRRQGAGPILLNLIHDVDLMRHLVGEIDSVQALESNAVRGHPVEETAAITLRFANGALGTISASDTVVAPWSWELTAGENRAYPETGQSCYLIGGTHGSLELPNLRLWTNGERRSWWEPISATTFPVESDDPLVRQVAQFVRVIRGEEPPLVPASEGLKTLEVIDAVKLAAASGRTASLPRQAGATDR